MTNLTDVPTVDTLADQLAGVRSLKTLLAGGTAVSIDIYSKNQLGQDTDLEDVQLSVAGISTAYSTFLNALETALVAALAALGVT